MNREIRLLMSDNLEKVNAGAKSPKKRDPLQSEN
jgi:hypothetical protein